MFIKKILSFALISSLVFTPLDSYAGKKSRKGGASSSSSSSFSSGDRYIDKLLGELRVLVANRTDDDEEFQATLQEKQVLLMQGISRLTNPQKMQQTVKVLQNLLDQSSQRRDAHRAGASLSGARSSSAKASKQIAKLNMQKKRVEVAECTLKAAKLRLDLIERKITLLNRELSLAEEYANLGVKADHIRKAEVLNLELAELIPQRKNLGDQVETAEKTLLKENQELSILEVEHGQRAQRFSDNNDDDNASAVSTVSTTAIQGRFNDVLNASYLNDAYQRVIKSGHVNFDGGLTAEMLFAGYQEYTRGIIQTYQKYKVEKERRDNCTTSSTSNKEDTELVELNDKELNKRLADSKANMLSVMKATQSVMRGKAEGLKNIFQNPNRLFVFIKEHVCDVATAISAVERDNVKTTDFIKELESLAMLPAVEFAENDSIQGLKAKIENALFALSFQFEKIELSFAIIKAAYPFICLIDYSGNAEVREVMAPFKRQIEKLEATYILYNSNIEELYERYKKLLEMTESLDESLGDAKSAYQDFMFALSKEHKENNYALLQKSRACFAHEHEDINKLISEIKAEQKRLQKERAHQKMVQTIKAQKQKKKEKEKAKAEERVELKKAQEAKQQSKKLASARAFAARECATDIDHYRQRYFAQVATARAESLRLLEEKEARTRRKAEAKAAKNHEAYPIDDDATSSDSIDDNASMSKALPSKQYRLFQAILSNKSREFTIQEVNNVVAALGGEANYKCAGSRVRLELPYFCAKEHSAVRVIHSHLTYGHKGLEGGRMKSVREMLAQAGYTADTVVLKGDGDSYNESDDDGVATTADGSFAHTSSTRQTLRRAVDNDDGDDDFLDQP